jgi:hypothetical protein
VVAVERVDAEGLIVTGQMTGGMIPKLRAVAWAVAPGLGEVRIGSVAGDGLADVSGTRVGAAARLAVWVRIDPSPPRPCRSPALPSNRRNEP